MTVCNTIGSAEFLQKAWKHSKKQQPLLLQVWYWQWPICWGWLGPGSTLILILTQPHSPINLCNIDQSGSVCTS